MEVIKTPINGLMIFKPNIYADERGHFQELFKLSLINKYLPSINFTQINESRSKKNVLRGLHLQKSDFAQSKLVRVVSGCVLDVVVDLRENSITYGEYLSFKLDTENNYQLFVPKGFAHGFIVQSNEATVQYFVDAPYSKENEIGINYASPRLDIDWGLTNGTEPIVSEKDRLLPDWIE